MRATCGPVEGLLRTSVSSHQKLDRGPHSYILMRSDVSKRGLNGYRQIMRYFNVLRKTHMIRHRVLPKRATCSRYVTNRTTADVRTSSTVMMVTQRSVLPYVLSHSPAMNHTCTTPKTIRGGGESPLGLLPIYLDHGLYDKQTIGLVSTTQLNRGY